MELKMKYQYTYFLYPYIVKENKFQKYLLKLLEDKKCHLRFFEKEKEMEMYTYFLPNIRKYLFPSFEYSKGKIRKWEELEKDTKSALLAQNPCSIFEYEIGKNAQGKLQGENGIFFKIEKVELICFHTGVCFLCMKTHLEDTENFEDLLNFNYKFRDIPSDTLNLKNFENIKIQTDSFENMEQINDWITKITGANIESSNYNLDTNRFLTYTYACIDQEAWNDIKDFKNVEHEFYKLTNVLSSGDNRSYNEEKSSIELAKWKYIRMGFSKLSTCIFSSTMDTYNYTKLPYLFENQYLYTYIINLYQKIYLSKLNIEFQKTKSEIIRKKYIEFTKNIYIQEITNDDTGSLVADNMKKQLDIDQLYLEIKNKYDVMYKEMNIEKDAKINKYILWLLIISFTFNIINFFLLFMK